MLAGNWAGLDFTDKQQRNRAENGEQIVEWFSDRTSQYLICYLPFASKDCFEKLDKTFKKGPDGCNSPQKKHLCTAARGIGAYDFEKLLKDAHMEMEICESLAIENDTDPE